MKFFNPLDASKVMPINTTAGQNFYILMYFVGVQRNELAFEGLRIFYKRVVDNSTHNYTYWEPKCAGMLAFITSGLFSLHNCLTNNINDQV